MGYELSKDQIAQRDMLWSKRNDIVSQIEELLSTLAEAVRQIDSRCDELIADYNENLADMVSFAESVADDIGSDDYPELFEAWNDWAPPDMYSSDLNIPDADQIVMDSLDDDITELPTESDE